MRVKIVISTRLYVTLTNRSFATHKFQNEAALPALVFFFSSSSSVLPNHLDNFASTSSTRQRPNTIAAAAMSPSSRTFYVAQMRSASTFRQISWFIDYSIEKYVKLSLE